MQKGTLTGKLFTTTSQLIFLREGAVKQITFNFSKIIIRILNEYLCYKHSLEMWTLIFSITTPFETNFKNKVQIMQTWEPRCRLIQDEDEGRRQRGVFLATELTADT